ncbi:c-type cytochrome [Allopusillimonas ginsengisoli]|uniref:c-type cytochrome n=1 Tax=Allopusillimonas ginsengisoli TaxID=453575 RepID=UPI00101ED8AC|nr:c-type cytochrome [Allopusillimonas ginsengisoli]TEA77137.1 c-type cytochrome [Allopusillimonas ginsengisoli]
MAKAISSRPSLAPVCITFCLALAGAGPALADPIADGQALATSGAAGVVACATCHGAQGEGMAAAGFPYLAGQNAAYLALQLKDLASGKRENAAMAPIAKAMNDAQIQAAAAYFAQLPAPFDSQALADHEDSYPAKDDIGAWLANRGDWDHNLPACVQCHGPGGVGVGEHFPALAGQPAKYIRDQLLAWKEGKRDPGPQSLMGDIASRMNDAQMTAVADYFSALPTSIQAATDKGGKQ